MKQLVGVVVRFVVAFVIGAFVVLAGLTLAWAQPAAAGGGVAKATVALSSGPRVDEDGNPVRGQLILAATVKTADGKPLSNQAVSFFEEVSFLGKDRAAFLGSATTDSTGVASVAYQPAHPGSSAVIARFAGSDAYAGSEAHLSVDVPEAVAPFPRHPEPLAAIGGWLAIGFGIATAAGWALILGVLLRSIRGLRSVAVAGTVRAEKEIVSGIVEDLVGAAE